MSKALNQSCKECSNLQESFFKYCSDEELERVHQRKMCNIFQKGQIIFFEGNHPLGLHCISKGTVKLYKTGIDGKELLLRIAKPGDFLGYRALIADENYSATAEALETTNVCFTFRDDFYKLIDGNQEMSQRMLKSLCHDMGLVYERIMNLSQKSARERLAEVLLMLWNRFHSEEERKSNLTDDKYIGIQLPRNDLANLAATTTETAIRLLSEFKDDGFVELIGKKILINNREALRKVARVM